MEIIDYQEKYKDAFRILNEEWLEKYFEIEPYDAEVLSKPDLYILDKGGKIFFAKEGEKILGTVALMPKNGSYELTKMAVTDLVQSKGIGKLLMKRCIEECKKMNVNEIFLFSSTKLDKAIQFYLKTGFIEKPFDASEYKRADIYMTLSLADAIID